MSGLSTTGSISFGIALVAGRKRVPNPATGKTALRTGLSIKVLVRLRAAVREYCRLKSDRSFAVAWVETHAPFQSLRCRSHRTLDREGAATGFNRAGRQLSLFFPAEQGTTGKKSPGAESEMFWIKGLPGDDAI